MKNEKKGGSAAGGAYIFLGPEIGKKRDAVDELRKKAATAGTLEETVFYAGETPVPQIADAILNRSLFSDSHLFMVKNVEQIKKKEDVTLLVSCIEGLDSGTVLILLSDEFKLAAGLDDAVPGKNRVIFYEMFENEKGEWVRSFFKREGRTIDTDGVDAILEMVENNTDALRRACSELLLFLPPHRPAGAQEIEKWLSHSREESAFTLFSRIAEGDLSKAVAIMHTLLAAKETAPGILAGLAWCFRKLRSYLALAETGKAADNFELRKIGIFAPKAKSDYAAASRRYNTQAVDACLALTAEYDILTRASGAAFEQTLTDVYLVKVFGVVRA
jgi:DNA polymerase-3 subunit delta